MMKAGCRQLGVSCLAALAMLGTGAFTPKAALGVAIAAQASSGASAGASVGTGGVPEAEAAAIRAAIAERGVYDTRLASGVTLLVVPSPATRPESAVSVQIDAGLLDESSNERGSAWLGAWVLGEAEHNPVAAHAEQAWGGPLSLQLAPDRVVFTAEHELPDAAAFEAVFALAASLVDPGQIGEAAVEQGKAALGEWLSGEQDPSFVAYHALFAELLSASGEEPSPRGAALAGEIRARHAAGVEAFWRRAVSPGQLSVVVSTPRDPVEVVAIARRVLDDLPRPARSRSATVTPRGEVVWRGLELAALQPGETADTEKQSPSEVPAGHATVLVGSMPGAPGRDASVRDRLVRLLASEVFAERVRAATPSGVAWAYARPSLWSRTDLSLAAAIGEPEAWQRTAAGLVRTVRGAAAQRVSGAELDDARRRVIDRLEKINPTTASGLASEMTRRLQTGDRLVTPAAERVSAARLLPGIMPAEVGPALGALFDVSSFGLVVVSPPGVGVNDEAVSRLREALRAEPQRAGVPALFAQEAGGVSSDGVNPAAAGGRLAQIGPSGKGVWSAWLGNGIRVHHTPGPKGSDTVVIRVFFAHGRAQETPETKALTDAAAITLAAHEGVRVLPLFDGLAASIETTPAEFDGAMRRLAQMFLDTRAQPEKLRWWVGQLRSGRTAKPEVLAEITALEQIFPPDDPRGRQPSEARLDAIDAEAVSVWLQRVVAAPAEIAIVGPVDRGEAFRAVAAALGGLGERARIEERVVLTAGVEPVLTPVAVTRTHPSGAAAAVGIGGADYDDLDRDAYAQMLAGVLTGRAKSAGVRVRAWPARSLRGMGLITLSTAVTGDAQPGVAADTLEEIVQRVASSGVQPEEAVQARAMWLETQDRAHADPHAWADWLGESTARGRDFDAWRDRVGVIREADAAWLAEQLTASLRAWLRDGPRVRVLIREAN